MTPNPNVSFQLPTKAQTAEESKADTAAEKDRDTEDETSWGSKRSRAFKTCVFLHRFHIGSRASCLQDHDPQDQNPDLTLVHEREADRIQHQEKRKELEKSMHDEVWKHRTKKRHRCHCSICQEYSG